MATCVLWLWQRVGSECTWRAGTSTGKEWGQETPSEVASHDTQSHADSPAALLRCSPEPLMNPGRGGSCQPGRCYTGTPGSELSWTGDLRNKWGTNPKYKRGWVPRGVKGHAAESGTEDEDGA